MNKKRKPSRAVFLLAAEYQFKALQHSIDSYNEYQSRYSCDNLNIAAQQINKDGYYDSVEYHMYCEYFKQDNFAFAWWPRLRNGNWDYGSRILALLLCAEILRR